VKGRGIVTAKGEGDLIVVVDVVVPANPTDAERKAIQELARVSTATPRAQMEV
jgi:molecular chaperone DnaJ